MSVLLTSYRHARFVEEALESVRAQTFTDYELIITDDASDDGSVDVIRSWLARTGVSATLLANEENIGIAAVRNRALAVATGRYVCSLSGDDAWLPQRLEVQVGALDRLGPEVGAVYSDMVVVDADGVVLADSFVAQWPFPPPSGRFLHQMAESSFVPSPAVMVRRSVMDDLGPYDETLAYEDFDMWLRLLDRYEMQYVPGPLVRYRRLPSSLSRRPDRRVDLRSSTETVIARWIGRSEALDRHLAVHLWRLGMSSLRDGEREVGRERLRKSVRLGVDARRGWVARAALVPGLGRPVATVVRRRSGLRGS